MKKLKDSRVFYGWFIVAACFMIMGVTVGIVNNCAGIFVKPVCADMGFSRRAMGMNNTLNAGASMVIALCAGKIFSRFDVRKVMKLSSVVLAASYFSYSFAKSLPMFYASSLLCGVSESLLVSVSLSMLISNWFHVKRGTAVGIAFMGSGIGGMICNPLASSLILNFGWRATYQILACIIFFVAVPMCFFIIKTRPSDIGCVPLGEKVGEVATKSGGGTTLAQAVRTPRFYAICICTGLSSICTAGLMHNIAPHISDVGFSPTFAAVMASVCMGALAIGKMLLGYFYDKLGARRATALSNMASIIGLVGALLVPFKPALAMIMIGTGLGGAFGSVANPIITQIVYGPREYSAILGVVTAGSNVGAMIAPLLVGSAYDLLGSYKPAFAAMLAIMFCIFIVYQFIFKKEAKVEATEKAIINN